MSNWKKKALELAITTDMSWRSIAKKLGRPKSSVSDFLRKAVNEGLHEPISSNNVKDRLKFLYIDIETSMIKTYQWSLWDKHTPINMVIEDWYLLCYSALWMGDEDDQVISDSLHHYPKPKSGRYKDNEHELVKNLWNLLDEANFICAYNGKAFDRKKINAKFLEYGYPEPSPYKVIDPMLIVKGNFRLTSNKLDWVTRLLGNDGKHSTDLQLWIDCMNDNEEQMTYMQEYCDKDVIELKDTYLKLRHWDQNSPNMALYYEDDKVRCNGCGSDDLEKLENKSANTTLSKFSVLRCNSCSKILRDRENTLSKEKRKSLLMNVGN